MESTERNKELQQRLQTEYLRGLVEWRKELKRFLVTLDDGVIKDTTKKQIKYCDTEIGKAYELKNE